MVLCDKPEEWEIGTGGRLKREGNIYINYLYIFIYIYKIMTDSHCRMAENNRIL